MAPKPKRLGFQSEHADDFLGKKGYPMFTQFEMIFEANHDLLNREYRINEYFT